jgi:hypothetical protein
MILNVDGFNGFIKSLVLSNYILSDKEIENYKKEKYDNENIDVEQLIVGLDYADKFKNICSDKSLGTICNIKSLMIPHIKNYWNIWKKEVVKKLGYEDRIKNKNEDSLTNVTPILEKIKI